MSASRSEPQKSQPEESHEDRVTTVTLPDGSESGGQLAMGSGGLVLRLYAEKDLSPGDEIEIPDDRYFTVTGVRQRRLDDLRVTEVAVQGPFLRQLEGHELGDGWPQTYWRDLAATCDENGFAPAVVRFLRFLGELRTTRQIGVARGRARSLSAEHLATVTGQVGGALLNLERVGAPDDLVESVSGLYRVLLEEMSDRCEEGQYPQPPNATTRIRFGSRQPDDWRDFRDWIDPVSGNGSA